MFHLALRGRQACTSIMRSSTVTRHAAPRGWSTGPHLSVGSIWYLIRNKHIQCVASPAWERRFTQCAVSPSSLLREEVYLVCSGPFNPLERGGLPSVQWALHPSWERRFAQCEVGPSSLLREEVYQVCNGPFLPLERGGLPGVQWAAPPSWERRFTQCAAGPSSLLREEVYPVCSEPLLPLERGGLYLLCSGPFIPHERGSLPSVQWAPHPSCERRFTQCAIGPSFLLREEVYPVCSGPPSLLREEVYT